MSRPPAVETVALEPHLFVLFGATGDLSRRKLLPALFRMFRRRDFVDVTHVLGVGRSYMDDDSFRALARDAISAAGVEPELAGGWCADNLSYVQVGEDLSELARAVDRLEERRGLTGNRAFYLAIPPVVFEDTVEGLAKVGLDSGPGWTRIVVEKPFGTDLQSAIRLNALLHRWFEEDQIYRIDHYLAKETVQNLLVFRFANPLFELAWNRDRIDAVQITVAETLGVEERAGYFDRAGILRDIVQNHLMQILSLMAMEPPVRLEADEIRDEKVKLLRAVYPVRSIVKGQYTTGEVDDSPVRGYREEPGIAPGSTTETYAALRLGVDNWRWRGVPFHLRAAKRMPRRLTQIAVRFKAPPVCLFDEQGRRRMNGNVLYITLQPEEGFDLMFDVKAPGEGMDLDTRPLSFRYEHAFGPLPDAYETLLVDLLSGDQTLFVRADEAEEAWRILAPVLDSGEPVHPYPAGSWGPEEADSLVAEREDAWTLRPPSG